MNAGPTLDAGEVRARFWQALAPVRVQCEKAMGTRPERLRFVVQLHPLVLRVTLAPDEGCAARCMLSLSGSQLPDGGHALGVAVTEMAGAILASLPFDSQAAVLANAAMLDAGGLFVMADPTDELAVLALSGPGGDLGRGTVLGALGEAPETVH